MDSTVSRGSREYPFLSSTYSAYCVVKEVLVDDRGKATGVAFFVSLLASIAVAAYQGHVLYGVTERGTEVILAENHRQILHVAAFVIAGGLAFWAAAFGTWRAWWKGAIALVAGALITGLSLSVLTFLDLPFIALPVGLEWLKAAAIPLVATWVIAIVVMRVLRHAAASRCVTDPLG